MPPIQRPSVQNVQRGDSRPLPDPGRRVRSSPLRSGHDAPRWIPEASTPDASDSRTSRQRGPPGDPPGTTRREPRRHADRHDPVGPEPAARHQLPRRRPRCLLRPPHRRHGRGRGPLRSCLLRPRRRVAGPVLPHPRVLHQRHAGGGPGRPPVANRPVLGADRYQLIPPDRMGPRRRRRREAGHAGVLHHGPGRPGPARGDPPLRRPHRHLALEPPDRRGGHH